MPKPPKPDWNSAELIGGAGSELGSVTSADLAVGGGTGAAATCGSARLLGCCSSTSRPSVRPMAPIANRSGRSSTNSVLGAAFLAVSGRPDGGGESVMTADLYGPGGPGLGLGLAPLCTFCPQRRVSIY